MDQNSKRYCQRIGRADFWGGESELLCIADHKESGSALIPIAEYGADFAKASEKGKAKKAVRLLELHLSRGLDYFHNDKQRFPAELQPRGSFPLNGTYFQVNEVFADDETCQVPLQVPRNQLINLQIRILGCETSTSSIHRGLSTSAIQRLFCTVDDYVPDGSGEGLAVVRYVCEVSTEKQGNQGLFMQIFTLQEELALVLDS
ncbi:transcriptional activator DEMETER-like protein [Tanacetum coccineum]